jgi:hypothetical protein
VVDLEISQLTKPLTVTTPSGPGILPPTLLTGTVKDTTQVSPSADNPQASVESMNSIVELKPDNTTGIEDV